MMRKPLAFRLADMLRDRFKSAYCDVLVAPDRSLRVLAVGRRFNGMTVTKKRDMVANWLKRNLSKEELSRVSSVNVYGSKELV